MWNKFKEKSLTVLIYCVGLFGLVALLYLPVKCSMGVYDRIQNPPSDIYAENQVFDQMQPIQEENTFYDIELENLENSNLHTIDQIR